MVRLTGLPRAVIVNNDLRLTPDRFDAELLRDQHKSLSLSDARVATYSTGGGGGRGGGGGGGGGFGGGGAAAMDAAENVRTAGFEGAYLEYLHHDLAYTGNGGSDIFYLLNGGVGAFTGAASDDASITSAFSRDPRMQLFVGIDYFDTSLPFYAAEWTLAHLALSPDIRAHNLIVGHYEAGAAPYSDDKALVKLHADLAKFVAAATVPAD